MDSFTSKVANMQATMHEKGCVDGCPAACYLRHTQNGLSQPQLWGPDCFFLEGQVVAYLTGWRSVLQAADRGSLVAWWMQT